MAATNKKEVSVHLPDDLAFSILSKLPLKSLKRFTCVRKSWSLLFEDPHFMNMFRTHFISKHHSLYNDTCLLLRQSIPFYDTLYMLSGERFDFEDRVRLDWPPPFQEEDTSCIQILGTCSVNGTLCVYQNYVNDSTIVLWNPATEQFKVIPPSRQPYENIEFNLPPQGFGYDRVRDDYKVIRSAEYPPEFEGNWVCVPEKDSSFWELDVLEMDDYLDDNFWEEQVVDMYDPFWEIYSLRSNSWRKLDGVDMPDPWPSSFKVNLNDVCHSLGHAGNMVSFDFTNEIFFETTLPSRSDMSIRKLVLLNGSVAFICAFDRTTYFHIWILGELGVKKSWTKLFVVGPFACVMYPISAWKNGNIFFRKHKDGKLVWFDLSTQGIEEIGVQGGSVKRTLIYKKNLLPIEGMNN